MGTIETFFKKYAPAIQLVLVLIAICFFSWDITRPLVDYDEATYAKVIVDTLHSGNILTFQLSGHNWFEKPPLLLWLTMGSVQVFGENEFAFRIFAILASVLCCWLVYLIAMELTRDEIAAALGFLVLLFSSIFFIYGRELRLDQAVIAAMLATLLFYLKGWRDERYLFWVVPLIAIGFLFKSVIILLIAPIILLYSFFYGRWSYLRSKYLWLGCLLSLAIVAPWHIYETLQFGSVFWDNYLGVQVFHRAVTTLTGTNGPGDYSILFLWYFPWNIALVAGLIVLFRANTTGRFKGQILFRNSLVPLTAAVFIFAVFTAVRTHLAPYIMPAFPFFAISVAAMYHDISSVWTRYKRILIAAMFLCVLVGAAYCIYLMPAEVPPYTADEKAIGLIYKSQDPAGAPLYLLDWIPSETFNYYGNTNAKAIDPAVVSGQVLHGPFYIATSPQGASYFFQAIGQPYYPGMKVLYTGQYFWLIYSDRDQTMPQFHWKP